MKNAYALLLVLIVTFSAQAQLTGTKNIPGDYTDLTTAIADLNTQGVGTGGVTFNLVAANPQTAPAGGYVIGGTGSVLLSTSSTSNPVIFQGNGNTVTASGAQVAGALNDAIFKLVGADWVTITGFTLTENSANTVTDAATNNMTEFGIALFYESVTNGAQNNTIQINTIDLTRTYQNSFGIYANATHSATVVTTSATATGADGGNHGLKIFANTITDVNNGIVVVGPTASADVNDGIQIGGAGATANIITNFGTTGTFSSYANVSGTVNGILVRNSKSVTVSNNIITSSNGGVIAGTINGIHFPGFTNAPTGTFTNNINDNVLSVKSGIGAGAINGINIQGTSASATSTINVNNNDFNNFGHTVSGTGAIQFIVQAGNHQFQNVDDNTFTNISVNTTGSVTFLLTTNSNPSATGVKNVNNNSIVTAFAKTGGGGTVLLFSDDGTDVAGSVNNFNNNSFSNITLTGATVLNGISFTNGNGATSANKTATGNVITNVTGGTSAITCLILNWDGVLTNVYQNIFHTITNGGAITGISSNTNGGGAGSVWNIFENAIHSFTGSGTGAVSGMNIGSSNTGRTINIYKNKIYNLQNTNAGGSVNGMILASGTTFNVYNNLVGDLKAPAASGADVIRGISITSTSATSTLNVSYNTVYINASSSGANFGTSGIFHTSSATATTASLSLRNNIIVNTSVPAGTGLTVAFRRTIGGTANSLNNLAANTNNNLYYAGAPGAANLIYYDAVNALQTLAAYKTFSATAGTLAPRESLSVTENPVFLSTVGSSADFLHINNTVATQIESGGTPVAGITDDFDAQVRNTTSPDIGADEFNGISADFQAPLIVYTALDNACTAGSRTLVATITDASGIPTSGAGLPVLYYRINAGAYTAVTGSSLGNNQYQFSIGAGSVAGDQVSYYIVAQDNAGTPNIGVFPFAGAAGFTANPPSAATPPSAPSTYSNFASLSGTFTVGVGGNYTTLTAAVADYNTKCVSGNVVFNLTDASYTTAETFPIVIQVNPNAGAGNTLTIKPATGVTSLISGSVASGALIRLNGADFVTIDGSNNGTSSRDLTITNTSTTAPTGLAISSLGLSAGAVNNTFKNLNISTGISTSPSMGISVGGVTPGTLGADNENTTLRNNNITVATIGIFSYGSTAVSAGATENLVISSNNITTNTTIATVGIQLGFGLNSTIADNTISVENSATTSPVGISIETGFTSSVISGNKIIKALSTNANGYGGRGITIGTASSSSALTVVNNMVSGVNGSNWTSFGNSSSMGIGVGLIGGSTTLSTTTGGVNLYYNSVHLSGNFDINTANIITAALYIGSGTSALDIRNNILSNALVNVNATSGGSAKAYAIYSAAANTAFSTIDYNNYYSEAVQPVLGYISSDRVDLTAIQAGFGGNVNSKNFLPFFVSPTDLHLVPTLNGQLENMGTPIPGITIDIDGDTRHATTPDMGADEFTAPVCSGAVGGTAVAGTSVFCNTGSTTITATGFSTGANSTYQWQISTDNNSWADITGATNPLTISTGTISDTSYYRLKVTCASGTALDYSNTVTVTINPDPTISITPSNPVICPGSNVTITASGTSDSYTWSPAAGLNVTTGSTVIAAPAQLTVYTVTGTITATGCTNTASVTVGVNPTLTVTASAVNTTICAGTPTQLNTVAVQNVNPVKITEVTVFRTGTGQTATYPAYIAAGANDFVEISNISSAPFDISGYNISAFGNNSLTATHTYTFPAGTIIAGNSVLVVHLGSGTNNIASGYHNTGGTTDNWSSTSQVGIVLKNGTSVIDAVGLGGSATGSYTFNAATGVSAADWSGFAPNASGLAGVIRSVSLDNNLGSDWVASGTAVLQTIGTYNGSYTLPTASFTYSWSPAAGLSNTTIANPIATPGADQTYTVTVTETVTGCSNTASVSITVQPPLTITTQPVAQMVCDGTPATFNVNATGGGTLTYQWKKNGTDINGATSASYTIPAVTAADVANYEVTITSSCGSVTSTQVGLTMLSLVSITTQPVAVTECNGNSASFSVVAIGAGPLSYQWRKNGVNISGATSATYANPFVTNTDAGNYDVVITGVCGSTTSNAVALTVNPKPVADFTFTATQCAGTSYVFTNTSTVSSGTITGQAWDFGDGTTSTTVNPNHTYAVAGSYTVKLVATASNGCKDSVVKMVLVNNVTAITTPPTAQTACSGGTVSFSVTASGTGLSYQWRKGTTPITGATSSTLTLNNVTAADAASYDVVVTGTCGNATSNAVTLTLNAATTITAQPVAATACQGNVLFSVTATGAGTLTYQWRFNGTDIPTATGSSINVPVIPAANGSYDVVVTGTCGSVTSTAAALTVQNCTAIPNVDATITEARLLPNIVTSSTVLRVISTRSAKINWTLTDINGRTIMLFNQKVNAGQNDQLLQLSSLASGMYQLNGYTEKGKVITLRLSRL